MDHVNYNFTFLGLEVVPKGRPRFSKRGHTYTPAKTKLFESNLKHLFAHQMKRYGIEIFTSALYLSITICVKKPKSVKRKYISVRPDLDNYLKAILDAGNGVIFKDDGQVVELCIKKQYAPENSLQMILREFD